MSKLNDRAKTLIAVGLFAAVFIALVCVATFYDLDVSKILTQNALPEGEYLANDFFGVYFEIFGTSPVYLALALVTVIFFWYFAKVWKLKPLKQILAAICFALGVVAFWFFIKDIVKYILEHAGNEAFKDNAAVICVELTIALVLNTLAVFAMKSVRAETIKKLMLFGIAVLFAIALSNIIIMLVKDAVGRMRFRSMNAMGDFSGFTKWFEMNGSRVPTEAEMEMYGWADDAFKSFPSGHTNAAASTYSLILLPAVLGIKDKRVKAACWIIPVAFTGLVAISRIVCGAHFMSDVTFGGTIGFLSFMLAKEMFIDKFAHFKAVFGKNAIEQPVLE